MLHEHKTKVVDWGFDEEHNWVATLYGCTECDETFVDLPPDTGSLGHLHAEYVEGCFGCKIKTLELSTGDANGKAAMASKKWDSENEFYASAVAQGINPDGVFRHEVEAAFEASEKLGKAYDTDTSPLTADQITSETADVMREVVMEDKLISKGQ